MEILSLEDINLTTRVNDERLTLQKEYEKLYQEALLLKNNPKSKEYQENKQLRQLNTNRRLELFL